ncbi:MAG: DNA polymerase III subunit chi [Roseinatronobacter sp.]|uniref:DNA polymerase III chi subunit n=1 Tax=Roseinatronobacter monicus TaxID=393481 RepID=A0A543KBX6_9RHOB|nr:DNA polymerase III subunit chi [Roseinatronobacter monicus]TQM92566.1 DNA polymerase III chi subunit [Roseinatronobacter monicus]TVQ04913.1 MAG: DNA polymerase III subunit chi [Roseinatronobacter sp.]
MGKAMFYHVTRNPLEVTVANLLTRAVGQGMRVAVRARDQARLEWLDAHLWLGDKASFLPHGLAGGAHDADQPILLTTQTTSPNNAQIVMTIDAAEAHPEEVEHLERLWILFDGNDPAAVAHARGQWKAITAAGVIAEYWSEDSGRWEKKAQSGGEG